MEQEQMTRRSALVHGLTAAAGLPASLQAQAAEDAQRYPSRPVRFIVAFPAGSGTDIQARIIGEPIAAD
jgi:tripartite-type tricarboxylate transporter receptor subunit TctC